MIFNQVTENVACLLTPNTHKARAKLKAITAFLGYRRTPSLKIEVTVAPAFDCPARGLLHKSLRCLLR